MKYANSLIEAAVPITTNNTNANANCNTTANSITVTDSELLIAALLQPPAWHNTWGRKLLIVVIS